MKVTDISNEIKKKIVQDREKDYGDYQYNFSVLADLFTLILAENLKKKLNGMIVLHKSYTKNLYCLLYLM